MCHLPAGIYEYFFKVEANPVEMRCPCFYSAVMANSKLDYSDLKVHALHYANDYLYASDFPFKNFCKIAQHTETIRKNVCEKSNDAYSLSIRVQPTINHISIFTFLCFFMTISTSKKMFSSRARAEKGIAPHIDASGVVWT